jgi:hypothetical protein
VSFDRNYLPDPVSYFEAEGLKLDGRGPWRTTECKFHGGSDSMRINLASGGWCCMSCNAKGGDVLAYHMAAHGLDFIAAVKDLGAWVEDGQPHRHHRPKPLPAGQAITMLAFESCLIATAGANLARGVAMSQPDLARLMVAAGRIQHIAEVFA